MKKISKLFVLLIMVLLFTAFVPFKVVAANSKQLLEQYANNQTYLGNSNQVFHGEIKKIIDADGFSDFRNNLPQNIPNNPISYRLDDFDEDGDCELLIVRFDKDYYVILDMYEVENNEIVLKDSTYVGKYDEDIKYTYNVNIGLDLDTAIFNCFTYSHNGKKVIGIEESGDVVLECPEMWILYFMLSYDGSKFNIIGNSISVGSVIDNEEMNNNLKELGINTGNREEWLGKDLVSDYIEDSEIFASVINDMPVDFYELYDSEKYDVGETVDVTNISFVMKNTEGIAEEKSYFYCNGTSLNINSNSIENITGSFYAGSADKTNSQVGKIQWRVKDTSIAEISDFTYSEADSVVSWSSFIVTIKGKNIGTTTLEGKSPDGQTVSYTINIYNNESNNSNIVIYYDGSERKQIKIDYSLESCLYNNATIYNPNLAYLLSALTVSSYDLENRKFTLLQNTAKGEFPSNPLAITESLYNLGFDAKNGDIKEFNYYSNASDKYYDEGTTAFTLGFKELDDGTKIVSVIVRGSYGSILQWTNDWAGNADFKNVGTGLHEGFNSAAEKIITEIKAFRRQKDIGDNKVKYVITGHSRGAAVSNLVAKKLVDEGIPNENIYDYNFACPDSAIDYVSNWNKGKRYANIFNINNVKDIVGVIPGNIFNSSLNIRNFISGKAGLAFWGKYGNTYFFSEDWETVNGTMIGSLSEHDSKLYMRFLQKKPNILSFKSWEEARLKLIVNAYQGKAKLLGIFCPVDVAILSKDGSKVAEIINGKTKYYTESFNDVVIINSGEQSLIYINGNKDYYVKFVGNDIGKMTYCVNDALCDEKKGTETLYSNIDITPGKTMLSSINGNKESKDISLVLLDETNSVIKSIKHDGTEEDISDAVKFEYKDFISKNFDNVFINNAVISGILDEAYTGFGITQSPVVKLNGNTLTAGTDYVVSYKNNYNPGTATITFTGKGKYTGSLQKTFKIKNVSIAKSKTDALKYYDSVLSKEQGEFSLIYLTDDDIPDLIHTEDGNLNHILINGEASTIDGNAGIMSYGTTDNKLMFSYFPRKNLVEFKTSQNASDVSYFRVLHMKNSYDFFEMLIKITNSGNNGNYYECLSEEKGGRYYHNAYKKWVTDKYLSDNEFTNAVSAHSDGVKKVSCSFISNTKANRNKVFFNIEEKKSTEISTENGKKNISNSTVSSISNKTFTGGSIKPVPTVKIGNANLKNGTDYSLSYSNNKNVGVAKITITGKGQYTGSTTKTFNIIPKGTKISKIQGKKKSFVLKWKKQPKQVTGYQIQYALKKNMKSRVKYKKVSGAKKTSVTIKKLKSKKNYFVRIRTYKKVGSKTLYSSWSKIKKVRIK